jgi:hypothetical protein
MPLKEVSTMSSERVEKREKRSSLQPTLYVGLGGFGCDVVRAVKRKLQGLGDDYLGGTAYIGLDTKPYDINDVLSQKQYIPMAAGVRPDKAAKRDPKFLEFYLALAKHYNAKAIDTADRHKVIGRLGFRFSNTLSEYVGALSNAWKELNEFKKKYSNAETEPKVYVVATMAGGTGAGCLLDALMVTGHFLRQSATGKNYYAILATGDVLSGEVAQVSLSELFANTYATLKELHHFYGGSGEEYEAYDKESYKSVQLGTFNLPDWPFLIGDENESGKVIAREIDDLGSMVASYLIAEITTPITSGATGFKLENSSTFKKDAGGTGVQRRFASFGLVQAGFPIEVIEDLFSRRIAQELIAAEVRAPADDQLFKAADEWLDSQKLKEAGHDQLQDRLKDSAKRDRLEVTVDAEGTILQRRVKKERLADECRTFMTDLRATVDIDKRAAVQTAGDALSATLLNELGRHLDSLVSGGSIAEAAGFAGKLRAMLEDHRKACREETNVALLALAKQEQEVKTSIEAVAGCVHRNIFQRKRYIEVTVSSFGTELECLLKQQVDVWVKQAADGIYEALISACRAAENRWAASVECLRGRLKQIEEEMTTTAVRLDRMANIEVREAGNRYSLVNAARAWRIYADAISVDSKTLLARTRKAWLALGWLTDSERRYAEWRAETIQGIGRDEVRPKLEGYDILKVIEDFYPTREDKNQLFVDLSTLSAPLFKLDKDYPVAGWDWYWVIAVHPRLTGRFHAFCREFLPGQKDINKATYDTPYEIVLYQVKAAYVIHQLRNLILYRSKYDVAQQDYQNAFDNKQDVPPVECWVEADEWEPPEGRGDTESGRLRFIVARAFAHLFPAAGVRIDDKSKRVVIVPNGKGEAFIWKVGSSYFMRPTPTKKVKLGASLEDAVRSFLERLDWQEEMGRRVDDMLRVAEVGRPEIGRRLTAEFMPMLKAEVDASERRYGDQDKKLSAERRKLQEALSAFITAELTPSL